MSDFAQETRGNVGEEGAVAGATAMGISQAVPHVGEAADALLAGGELEAGLAAPFAFGAASVIGAGAAGYELGSILEEHTHIGANLGDHIYDATHPDQNQNPFEGQKLDAIDQIVVPNTDPDLDAIDSIVYQNPDSQ